jgi:hypothetical protein
MGIFDLFSKRQKRLRGEVPDVYTYDDIPEALRIQVVHILRDTLGSESEYTGDPYSDEYRTVRSVYQSMNKILCHEYGVFSLVDRPSRDGVIFDVFQ